MRKQEYVKERYKSQLHKYNNKSPIHQLMESGAKGY